MKSWGRRQQQVPLPGAAGADPPLLTARLGGPGAPGSAPGQAVPKTLPSPARGRPPGAASRAPAGGYEIKNNKIDWIYHRKSLGVIQTRAGTAPCMLLPSLRFRGAVPVPCWPPLSLWSWGINAPGGVSREQSRGEQSPPSPCWPPCCRCSPGYGWLSGLQAHIACSYLILQYC